MSFEDNETNGRPGDDEDENEELEEDTEDKSEEHVSEEIAEREGKIQNIGKRNGRNRQDDRLRDWRWRV
jgi:hypothetical protein